MAIDWYGDFSFQGEPPDGECEDSIAVVPQYCTPTVDRSQSIGNALGALPPTRINFEENIESSPAREAAPHTLHGQNMGSPCTPAPYIPFGNATNINDPNNVLETILVITPSVVDKNTGTFGVGNTWSDEIGGYGDSSDYAPFDVNTNGPITRSQAQAHLSLMAKMEDEDPWKDDFEMVMQEVAFNARCGPELHHSENKYKPTPIILERGSSDPFLLQLVGREPKGERAFKDPIMGHHWLNASWVEVCNLFKNGTYNTADLDAIIAMKKKDPLKVSLCGTHFIFKVKTFDDGKGQSLFDKLRARLVYQGNFTTKFIDWNTSHAPALKMDTFRILMALTSRFDLFGYCGDFVAAFLQAELKEKHMYGRFPKGFSQYKNGIEQCMHFKKNIYGMVQAARNWFHEVKDWMIKECTMGFNQLGSDQCVFIAVDGKDFCIVFLYVDDLGCLTTNPRMKEKLFALIHAKFDFVDKDELQYFLGINISRDRVNKTLTLDMKAYVQDKLKLFNLETCKSKMTPWPLQEPTDIDYGEVLDGDNATLYRAMVGASLWTTIVRADVGFSVSKLSSHMKEPRDLDLQLAKGVFRYLKGTLDNILTYSRQFANDEPIMGVGFLQSPEAECIATGYVDSNLAAPRSTTGYAFKMAGGFVVAKSKKQPVVAISSYDGEYYAFSSAVLVGEWIRMLGGEINHLFLAHFGVHLVRGPLVIHGDNSAVIRMIQEKAISDRARHIQLRWHDMMQAIENKEIEAHGIAGRLNCSDILTKGLDGPSTTLQRHDLLGLKLMDKLSGVTIPKYVKCKPVITMSSYQAIMNMYEDIAYLQPVVLNDDVWSTMLE